MTASQTLPQTRAPERSAAPAPGPVDSPDLAADLDRLEREERVRRDRVREEQLAQLRELARFD